MVLQKGGVMKIYGTFICLVFVMFSSNVSANDVYGAIALSKSTANFGYCGGRPSSQAAEQQAVRECENVQNKHPGDCKSLIWFKNDTCGAIAFNGHGDFGAGYGTGHDGAHRAALEKCNDMGKPGCKVYKSVCPR